MFFDNGLNTILNRLISTLLILFLPLMQMRNPLLLFLKLILFDLYPFQNNFIFLFQFGEIFSFLLILNLDLLLEISLYL